MNYFKKYQKYKKKYLKEVSTESRTINSAIDEIFVLKKDRLDYNLCSLCDYPVLQNKCQLCGTIIFDNSANSNLYVRKNTQLYYYLEEEPNLIQDLGYPFTVSSNGFLVIYGESFIQIGIVKKNHQIIILKTLHHTHLANIHFESITSITISNNAKLIGIWIDKFYYLLSVEDGEIKNLKLELLNQQKVFILDDYTYLVSSSKGFQLFRDFKSLQLITDYGNNIIDAVLFKQRLIYFDANKMYILKTKELLVEEYNHTSQFHINNINELFLKICGDCFQENLNELRRKPDKKATDYRILFNRIQKSKPNNPELEQLKTEIKELHQYESTFNWHPSMIPQKFSFLFHKSVELLGSNYKKISVSSRLIVLMGKNQILVLDYNGNIITTIESSSELTCVKVKKNTIYYSDTLGNLNLFHVLGRGIGPTNRSIL